MLIAQEPGLPAVVGIIIAVVAFVVFLIVFFVFMRFFRLWIQAKMTRARISGSFNRATQAS